MRDENKGVGDRRAFTDGSGLDDKGSGGFCSNPNRLDKDRQPDLSKDQYLGIGATHFDGELAGIVLALEGHNDINTNTVALLSDFKPVPGALPCTYLAS